MNKRAAVGTRFYMLQKVLEDLYESTDWHKEAESMRKIVAQRSIPITRLRHIVGQYPLPEEIP